MPLFATAFKESARKELSTVLWFLVQTCWCIGMREEGWQTRLQGWVSEAASPGSSRDLCSDSPCSSSVLSSLQPLHPLECFCREGLVVETNYLEIILFSNWAFCLERPQPFRFVFSNPFAYLLPCQVKERGSGRESLCLPVIQEENQKLAGW